MANRLIIKIEGEVDAFTAALEVWELLDLEREYGAEIRTVSSHRAIEVNAAKTKNGTRVFTVRSLNGKCLVTTEVNRS